MRSAKREASGCSVAEERDRNFELRTLNFELRTLDFEPGTWNFKPAMKTLARERDKVEVLRRLRAVRPDSERRWGRMSAHQMICHLSDAFRVVVDQKPVSMATGFPQRTVVKWAALYLPVPWPAGILTRPEIDQELAGTKPSEFGADVAGLEALVDRVIGQIGALDGRVHPIFGSMSETAWLRWGYLHMDHHLRQFGK
jgi:hypothetical protein